MTTPSVVYASPANQIGVVNGADQLFTYSGHAVGDLVVLMGGHFFRAGTPLGPVAEANRVWTPVHVNDAVTQAWGVWISPITSDNLADATVSGAGTENAADACAYTLHVLRDVDLSDPIAAISAQGSTRTPPALVTPVDECLVMACASISAPDSAIATLAGYSSQASSYGNDTNDITVVSAVKAVAVAGTETPPEYTGLTSTNPKSITLAFRPEPAGAPANSSNFFQFH